MGLRMRFRKGVRPRGLPGWLVCGSLLAPLLAVSPAWGELCGGFTPPSNAGTVRHTRALEASGLVAGRVNTNVLWLHNDSGNAAELLVIGRHGAELGTYSLTGAVNIDWEDLAIGPGPEPGAPYLYVGDIGDNNAVRSGITVYRVKEPVVGTGDEVKPLSGVVALPLTYPDGAHDAETLLVDPRSGDLYVVTKNTVDGVSGVYRAAFPQSEGASTTLELVATVTFPGALLARAATGGDIAPSGSEIVVRAYAIAYRFFRAPGQSIAAAFGTTPCLLALGAEFQGESFAFDYDGNAYFTVSEGVLETLHRSDREPPLPVPSVSVSGQWSLMGGLLIAGVLGQIRGRLPGRARPLDRVRSRA